MIKLFFILPLLTLLLIGCGKSKYESPAYRVISKDGAFEIRDYPQMCLVTTQMQHRGEDGSFMKLFRFIQGRNEKSEKISMTVPVIMSGCASGTMSFILPKAVSEQGAPIPSNPDVRLTTLEASRYATFRFSGSDKLAQSEVAAQKLLIWVADHKVTTTGAPFFAYYNPPWTLGFLRRNEVLIRVTPSQ